MIKAVIFDCFGVVYSDNFVENYRKFGGDYEVDKDFIEEIIFEVSAGRLKSSSQLLADRLGIEKSVWRESNKAGRQFNYDLLEYTKKLRKKYKVSMLSNISSSGLKNHMDYSVLQEHFDDIVESARIGFAKPEARAYEIAAERLGVRLDECLFIDDKESYVEGATHVGMKAVLYKDVISLKLEIENVLKIE